MHIALTILTLPVIPKIAMWRLLDAQVLRCVRRGKKRRAGRLHQCRRAFRLVEVEAVGLGLIVVTK